jgi:hypothetical protein
VKPAFFDYPSRAFVPLYPRLAHSFVLLTIISRFLAQSPASENKSVAAFYICPYIDHEKN